MLIIDRQKLYSFIIILVFNGSSLAAKRCSISDNALCIKKVNVTFPEYFKFGTATASYQIEGGWDSDGKGPSIWDTFTHDFPDKIVDRSNGNIAANSYKLYEKDVEALKQLNAHFYRFSISWPRILPTGDISSKNQAGIDYYHKLINKLLENNIEPMVTLYHWDLPQPIQDLGGFTNPLMVDWFEQYANLIFSEYGTKVKLWITFNEPHEYCDSGYGSAIWPPQIHASGIGNYLCAHHTILAHARAYHLYKAKYYPTQKGKIGITLNSDFNYPKDPKKPEDAAAAERAIEFGLGRFAHPIFSQSGGYPEVVRYRVDKNSIDEGRPWSRLPSMDNDTIEYVKGTADFLGLNYYTSRLSEPSTDNLARSLYEKDVYVTESIRNDWPHGKSSWLYSVPDGLHQLLKWIRDNYDNPEVKITENGWSDDGELNDDNRIKYLKTHLYAIYKAMKDGCHVTAHTTWSLIDNFEWLMGYTEKFGVVRVDVTDPERKREMKDSSEWLKVVFKTRTLEIDDDDIF